MNKIIAISQWINIMYIGQWNRQYKNRFILLSLEMTLCQVPSNLNIYNEYRMLDYCVKVQIPTKARSAKNLFGMTKNNNTREGIFYVFTDLILICSKEKKVCLIYFISILCLWFICL